MNAENEPQLQSLKNLLWLVIGILTILIYYSQFTVPAISEEKSSDSDATSESYEVEATLDHAQNEKNPHIYSYYVRWKGYGPEHNSWIPFTNFDDIQILRNYGRQQRKQLFPPYALDNVSDKEQESIKNKGTLNKRKRLTTDGTMPAQIASSSQNQDVRRSQRNRL
ncbi:hypothetical protein K457DRAFT_84718 [Linnemannia elongata AG-77]|uniref:Chromo domain-containing protein n=1 Tax=Linnemannia elongata AG-77 TaxID=1314771 RepID=A0A197JBM1_9FUNG|nr:hypothetical protein K457DRAFT_84718 [Linnemannia elongata AG-77]